MDLGTILLLAAVAGVILYIVFGQDKLANALRARFKSAKSRAADAVDDAVARIEAAEADADGQLTKANEGLIAIKSMRKQVENKLADAKAKVSKYETAAENAASVQRADLVTEALTRKTEAEAERDSLQAQYDKLVAKEQEVQAAVTALEKRKATLRKQKVDIKSRAKTATVTIGVNELLAGVDLKGRQKDVERAYEIVDELEGRSGAMAEVAGAVMARERVDEELEALSKPQADIDAEAATLMAKYAKPTTTQS